MVLPVSMCLWHIGDYACAVFICSTVLMDCFLGYPNKANHKQYKYLTLFSCQVWYL
jgi:hypothetical protein